MMLLTAGVSHKPRPSRFASDWQCRIPNWLPWREAEIARAGGLTGRVLHRVFQKAFQAAKEIRTRTEIGRGAVSIKSAAVELVGRIFEDDLAGRAIMVIGAGQMAECCVRLLVKRGARSILISNRSLDRALDLAMRWGGQAVMPPKGMPRQRP